ncbi:MAG: cation:proton antiporter [Candidatus Eremiobacteraeota bacterium]|nr:cation:proton antiporter [Candidatus Eremiobacteraeota bacterium]
MEGEGALFDVDTARALAVISIGAFAIPLGCRRISLPAAVGEILYGVVVGPYVLGWVTPTDFIHLGAHLGFFMLMFIAGLELDFRRIERVGRPALVRGASIAMMVMLGGFTVAYGFGWPWFTGMVMSAVSIGVPIALLQETGLGRKPLGQDLLLVGSVGEFFSILLATGVNAFASSGGWNLHFLRELAGLVAVFALAYLVLVILRTWVWWQSEAFARVVESHDPSEVGVRAGLALMFVFVCVTTYLGIDPILGAFLAGALFSFVFRARGPLELKFMSLGNGFFVPFFFISVGLDFNLPKALEGDFWLVLKMLISLFVVRVVAFLFVGSDEQTPAEGVVGALLLSAPLTLLVVVANLGLHLGFIDRSFHATVILLAVLSAVFYPYLFKQVLRRVESPPPAA